MPLSVRRVVVESEARVRGAEHVAALQSAPDGLCRVVRVGCASNGEQREEEKWRASSRHDLRMDFANDRGEIGVASTSEPQLKKIVANRPANTRRGRRRLS